MNFGSAIEIAKAIKQKQVSVAEIVQSFLEKFNQKNQQLNAFTWLDEDRVLQEARDFDHRLKSFKGELPAFYGVPLPIKDLTEVQGDPITWGSKASGNTLGRYDASVITKLREAGFLFFGRTNSPELGTIPVTENERHGATRNPWHTEYTSGGSSGGAAAAVAAGMAPIAHASDGGGSIRIPAACCGLVGLKPSRGRIPKGPHISETMHGFSTDGCVSKTVADTAAFLDAVSHTDPYSWSYFPPPKVSYLESLEAPMEKLKIGVCVTPPTQVKPQTDVVDAVHGAAQVLRDLGHEVFEFEVPWQRYSENVIDDFLAVWKTIPAYAAFKDWNEAEELNRALFIEGQKQNSIEYVQAVLRLQVFSRLIMNHWKAGQVDVMLTPVLAMPPPPVGWVYDGPPQSNVREFIMRCNDMVPYTAWVNVVGNPSISVPYEPLWRDLPASVQFIGPPYREEQVLKLARQFEKALPWAYKYS